MACLNIKRYDRRTLFFVGSVQSSLPIGREKQKQNPSIYARSWSLTRIRQRASGHTRSRNAWPHKFSIVYKNSLCFFFIPGPKGEIYGLIGIPFHNCRTGEHCLSAIVLQSKGEKLLPWRTTGVIEGLNQQRFRRIAFYQVMRKLHLYDEGGARSWPPFFAPVLWAMMTQYLF